MFSVFTSLSPMPDKMSIPRSAEKGQVSAGVCYWVVIPKTQFSLTPSRNARTQLFILKRREIKERTRNILCKGFNSEGLVKEFLFFVSSEKTSALFQITKKTEEN